MSELDTYFRPTGRSYGQRGSLTTGNLSLMERRQAVAAQQNETGRVQKDYDRVARQLGRRSRRDDVDAGLALLGLRQQANERGVGALGGIRSADGNREMAAQQIVNNSELAGLASGGSPAPVAPIAMPSTQAPGIDTQSRQFTTPPPPQPGLTRQPDGSFSRIQAGRESAPTPSPMLAGQRDRSGSGSRVGMVGNGDGGTLTDSDKELLAFGNRVDGMRPGGFGNRPGGQFGMVAGTAPAPVQRPMPVAPSPSPMPAAPAAPMPAGFRSATETGPEAARIEQQTKSRIESMRQQNKMDTWLDGVVAEGQQTRYDEGMAGLDRERTAIAEQETERNARRAQEDAAYERERSALEKRIADDREAGARKIADTNSRRVTVNWQGERRDPSIGGPDGYSARDRQVTVKDENGNETLKDLRYRPRDWTQEDEDGMARDASTANAFSLARRAALPVLGPIGAAAVKVPLLRLETSARRRLSNRL